jgi:hypothetical protein
MTAAEKPTWAILIPTIPQREALFMRLLRILLPQLDAHGERVRVIAWRNSGSPRLAEIRDELIADAGTDYVSFIDDDDTVPEYYADEVIKALDSRPDHVGFKLAYYRDGNLEETVEHSMIYSGWGRTRETGQLYRDFTHVDPIRRDLAVRGHFARARPNRAEDKIWVRQVRPFLDPAAEVYIDKIMYHYLWRPLESSWQNPGEIVPAGKARPEISHHAFSWHPRSDT